MGQSLRLSSGSHYCIRCTRCCLLYGHTKTQITATLDDIMDSWMGAERWQEPEEQKSVVMLCLLVMRGKLYS